MFGGNLRSVFASRWKALWWAAGVLFTAWTMVPAADPDDQPAPSSHPASKHVNPWAKTAK